MVSDTREILILSHRIENATLIAAASIPALRPLFTSKATATETSSYGTSTQGLNKHSYQCWDKICEGSKVGDGGTSADRIELRSSSSDGHIFKMGLHTDCVIGAEEQPVGVSYPQGAIVKTMSTKFAF